MDGTIIHIVEDRGFGFIRNTDETDVFFHFKDLDDQLDFDATLLERRVSFEIVETPKGTRATNVRAD